MPFVRVSDRLVLRCANHDALKEDHDGALERETTMTKDESWSMLMVVRPHASDSTVRPKPVGDSGYVVRSYVCSVCGYVEFYDARTSEPETWQADTAAAGW